MTFTRRSDSSVLTPKMVLSPFDQSRESSTRARRLAQSAEVRVTYTGAGGPRQGEMKILLSSYVAVNAAAAFFTSSSLFEWDGDDVSVGAYTIVGDYIVETADTSVGDYALVFAVTGAPSFTGSDDRGWELSVPYMEVPE